MSSSNGDNATVWICNDQIHHDENRLKENITQFNIEGRSWAVSQVFFLNFFIQIFKSLIFSCNKCFSLFVFYLKYMQKLKVQ